jgi:hypothetical protein
MKRSIISIAFLFCFTGLLMAAEYPVEQNVPVIEMISPPVEELIENHQTQPSQPVWTVLEDMDAETRANSNIDIELGSNESGEAIQLADRIAALWNAGDYTKALQLFPQLSALTDDIAIGNCWRIPITSGDALWGTDVQIGSRTGIIENEFDKHWGTGNLFVVLLLRDGLFWRVTVNISTDNGDSWSETFVLNANFQLNTIGAAALSDWCFVGYSGTAGQNKARIRRFNAFDGVQDTFPDGSYRIAAFDGSDVINEIVLISNQDWYDNLIYYFVLCADNTITCYYTNADCTYFNQENPGINNAREGLDATCNEGYSDYFMMFSYLNNADQLSIWGHNGYRWNNLINYNVNSSATDYTSIGAYYDTITCAFDYYNGSNLQCRYLANYTGGGGTWYYGDIGNPDTTGRGPDVACRRGGGTGLIHYFSTSPIEERFIWRDYAGSWSSPDAFNDHEPSSIRKPNIEYLGDGCYGAVYVRSSGWSAWFDKCTAGSCLDISMINHGPDPVPAGGRFQIEGILENTCAAPQMTDVWYGVQCFGSYYEQGVYRDLTVQPHSSIAKTFWQWVPGYAPAGGYAYAAYFGDYDTGTIEGRFSFTFSVTSSSIAGGATKWSTIGGMFDDYGTSEEIPGDYALHENLPNPFNATTTITYDLPFAGDVNLEIYNLMGQKVATLADGWSDAGHHVIKWDASSYSSGVYFTRLTAGDKVFTKRMTLLK